MRCLYLETCQFCWFPADFYRLWRYRKQYVKTHLILVNVEYLSINWKYGISLVDKNAEFFLFSTWISLTIFDASNSCIPSIFIDRSAWSHCRPDYHNLKITSWRRVAPREIASAGFFDPLTWCQCLTGNNSTISCTLLATNGFHRKTSLWTQYNLRVCPSEHSINRYS